MTDTLNLLPCPLCGSSNVFTESQGGVAFVQCDDCAVEGSPRDTRAEAVEAWNRRASPAAAVPEGALPPLPKGWQERIGAPYKGKGINDIPLTAQIHHMQAEIDEWRARAAVEADRARQDQSGHMPPFAAPAGQLDEIIVEAIAKGWGAPENAHKVMDTDLALAITREVYAMFATRCRAEGAK